MTGQLPKREALVVALVLLGLWQLAVPLLASPVVDICMGEDGECDKEAAQSIEPTSPARVDTPGKPHQTSTAAEAHLAQPVMTVTFPVTLGTMASFALLVVLAPFGGAFIWSYLTQRQCRPVGTETRMRTMGLGMGTQCERVTECESQLRLNGQMGRGGRKHNRGHMACFLSPRLQLQTLQRGLPIGSRGGGRRLLHGRRGLRRGVLRRGARPAEPFPCSPVYCISDAPYRTSRGS